MEEENKINAAPNGNAAASGNNNNMKLILGILIIAVYVWLGSVAISKHRQFAPVGDPTYDAQGRLDWTRTTTRTYVTGTRSAWNGSHTLVLLLTAAGTFVYWKKYFSK
jgi:hypothetical protein